ncbi:hypothetical protein M407DRAFT_242945 [Tulasnella calospora MUT 4182]|uniref:Uncharacterized protein n=1 Tax=Tulasnella calospora MUT 4182 TaxID=1051891 RepID=A0A0C3QCU3_9AGAM|nr:hypothetical protein M407DRAFT_242945 [Tulasnella calospora MUT 4182]
MSSSDAEVTISIKGPSELKLSITITLDKTVKDLKDAVASQSDVPADRQRLIYSGRVLKDEEVLSTYKIQSGHTVHMVKGVARTQPEASSSPQRLPTMAAGQSPSDPLTILNTPMAHGALAGFNPFADMGINPNDPNMLQNMMNSPAVQQQMDALMSRPEFLDTIINQDPVLRSNPQLQQIFRDPEMRRSMMEMMRNPEVMRMAEQMRQSGAMGAGGPFGGGLGGGLGGGMFGGLGGAGPSQQQGGVSPWAASFAQSPSVTSPPSVSSAASTTSPSGTTPAATSTANPSSPGSTAPPANPFGMIDPNMLQALLGGMGPPPPWLGAGTSPFGGSSATPPANLPPPEERFQTQLQQMAEMGFTNASQNIRALQAAGGNVQAAIEYIFSGAGGGGGGM